MLRMDRMLSTIAGLICAAAGLKGKNGKVLRAEDFDIYNREPDAPKELSMEHMFAVLSGAKS